MRPSKRIVLGFCAVVAISSVSRSVHSGDDDVYAAVDRGVTFLLAEIEKENPPVWTTDARNRSLGQMALETYALIVAGLPVDHPTIRGNLARLGGNMKSSRYTYGLACYVFALDAVITQLETDALVLAPRKRREKISKEKRIGRAYRDPLARAVAQLVSLQREAGGWGYGPRRAPEFDNSNSQFAVLALGVGAKRGVPIDRRVWLRILDLYVKGQQRSGRVVKERTRLRGASTRATSVDIEVRSRGWDYRNRGRANWSMTNAALSSLILVEQNVGRSLDTEQRRALDVAIRDGYGWLTTRWNPLRSHYAAYSLEKVGDLGGVELFGKHDWYQELSEGLVASQSKDGSWSGGTALGENVRVATSFALLILNRASSSLTRNAGADVVLSGRKASASDRSWVYVEKIDTSVHLPTLLRQIRLRPRPEVVKLLERLVDSYPREWRGELVPSLTALHTATRHSKIRRAISGCLAKIAGRRHQEVSSYDAWHARWKRAVEIGKSASRESVADLVALYRDARKSQPLKERVIWAMQRCRARSALPLLLDDLDASSEGVRGIAYRALRSFFIESPPAFDPSARKPTRKKQASEVRRWCEKRLTK